MDDEHRLSSGDGVAGVALEDGDRALVGLSADEVGVHPVEDDDGVGEREVVRVAEGDAHRRVPRAPGDEEQAANARRADPLERVVENFADVNRVVQARLVLHRSPAGIGHADDERVEPALPPVLVGDLRAVKLKGDVYRAVVADEVPHRRHVPRPPPHVVPGAVLDAGPEARGDGVVERIARGGRRRAWRRDPCRGGSGDRLRGRWDCPRAADRGHREREEQRNAPQTRIPGAGW